MEADFAAAEYRIGNKVVTRAEVMTEVAKHTRGPGKKPAKVPTTSRIAPDALAAWKASGDGWQTCVAAMLASHAPHPKSR